MMNKNHWRILAHSGAITGYKCAGIFDGLAQKASIFIIGAFVGFCLGLILIAYLNGG